MVEVEFSRPGQSYASEVRTSQHFKRISSDLPAFMLAHELDVDDDEDEDP